ncbi:DUF5710 domain-containing protein [Chishuiella sp.]|uniref:DUF5710 domain-containing protein n=1 Tax=Chishuiella sp. TaxID=1969467 RepID=UPI0028ACC7B7|nr:DUF5710 domain-containing protein [Chishuiella sp.]
MEVGLKNGSWWKCLVDIGIDLIIYFYFYKTKRNERLSMPLKINVPYHEKDFAKSKGAFWDTKQKTWFVPDHHKNINYFLQWIDTSKVSIIVKSPFFIAVNKRQCYNCPVLTTVITLASNNFYNLDNDDDGEKWLLNDYFSFFNNISMINNDEVKNIINELFPFYKIGYSKTIKSEYWANHCENCGAIQGDFYLHSEPGGAFFPMDIEDCERITLITIPTKFDVELNTGYTLASNSEQIVDYANTINLEEFIRNETPIRITRNQKQDKPSLIYKILSKIKAILRLVK